MDGGRTLRMIAEAAVSRNYLRGSITTVYGLNDYGVTVVGRPAEARVRSLSGGVHQVDDLVILASINGDPQLLCIIDAYGTKNMGASPYPPFPPPPSSPIWAMRGRDNRRDYLTAEPMVTALQQDDAWWARLQEIGVRPQDVPESRMYAWTDRWVISLRNTDRPDVVYCISLDASQVLWTYTGPSPSTHRAYHNLVLAAGQAYTWATYTYASGSSSETREGIVALDLANGMVRWGQPQSTGVMMPFATYDSGNLLTSGNQCIYELAAGNGDILATTTPASLGYSGGYLDQGSEVVVDGALAVLVAPPVVDGQPYPARRLVAVGPGATVRWDVAPADASSTIQIRGLRATSDVIGVEYEIGRVSYLLPSFGLVNVSTDGIVGARYEDSGNPDTSWLWFDSTFGYAPDAGYRWTASQWYPCAHAAHSGRILQVVGQRPVKHAADWRYGARRFDAGGIGYHAVRLLAPDLSVLWEVAISYPSRQPLYLVGYTPSAAAALEAAGVSAAPYWTDQYPFPQWTDWHTLLTTHTPRDVAFTATPDPYEVLPGGQRAWGVDVDIDSQVAVGSSSSLLFTWPGSPLDSGTHVESQAWVVTDEGLSLLGTVEGTPATIATSGAVESDIIALQNALYYTRDISGSLSLQRWKGATE